MFGVKIIPEAVESSDGRSYPAGLLTWRDEIPLMFTDETSQGHDGAFQVGVIRNLRRQTVDGETWIVGELSFDVDAEAAEAERLALEGQIAGISADVAEIWEETGGVDEMGFPLLERVAAEIVGATQLPMPAFAQARILTDSPLPVLVAALAESVDPSWFDDPLLEGPTPLTVEDSGRVYGHLAVWGTCHRNFEGMCVTPPTGTDYSDFHTGSIKVGDQLIPVGHITMGTGHAPAVPFNSYLAHYDNTGTCAADICVGEDEFGIWFAGAVREGVDHNDLRAAALSGDWRRLNGNMELVAALAVNVPGYKVPRLVASMTNGEQQVLLASGIVQPDPEPDPLDEIRARLDALETRNLQVEIEQALEVQLDEQTWGRLADALGR